MEIVGRSIRIFGAKIPEFLQEKLNSTEKIEAIKLAKLIAEEVAEQHPRTEKIVIAMDEFPSQKVANVIEEAYRMAGWPHAKFLFDSDKGTASFEAY